MSEQALIAVLTPLMPVIVSLSVVLFRYLMGKLPQEQAVRAEGVMASVVLAVEQMYKNLPGTNEDKKEEALRLASRMLADMRLKVSPETLNVLLEAAVHDLPPTQQSTSPAGFVQPGA